MTTNLKRLFFLGILFAILTACAPVKMPSSDPAAVLIGNPNPPQPGDGSLVRDTVQIVKTEVSNLNKLPQQITLKISFFLPTPCHQYRITMDQPSADKRINIQVYSLMKKDQPCTLMALNTPTEASLNLASLPSGHYTVWVNGEKAVEFDA
jgi:hypothetical protein